MANSSREAAGEDVAVPQRRLTQTALPLRATASGQRPISHAVSALGAALALAMLVVAGAACGDDDGDNARPSTTRSTDQETTLATEPPGTEPASVEPYITDLLGRYDEVTNQIVADPQVANDRDDPLIEEYLDLVEPGSLAEGAIQTWVENAEQGVSIRPYSNDAPSQATSLDGEVETVSENEVRFATCTEQNYRQYDGQGRQTEFVTGQSVPGQGTAARVDGEWRLRRLDIVENVVGCGSGQA